MVENISKYFSLPPVDLGRPGWAAEPLLGGEGVLLQPVQQGQVQRQPRVGELRGVDVGVDEAGQEELAGGEGHHLIQGDGVPTEELLSADI